ncbi:sialic acid-binding Ig-like lectin 13 [Tiliqua scincoides]|uniref:sialic acid-binding Ig-like lectin 13 n=1 Tax=Tiliqua scincoides TaxID=71010 RepID=UPI00346249C5
MRRRQHMWKAFSFLSCCVQCNEFKLYAPDAMSVPKGLCVAIPCYFKYPESHRNFSGPLYGYWYEKGRNPNRDPALATNDGNKPLVPDARVRFYLSDKLEEGNCSLFVTDVQQSDQKDYFFRMQKGHGYNYFPSTSVRVTETPKPEIQILGKLQAGQPVSLTCTVASCPWKSPQISWEFTRRISGTLSSLSDGTKLSNVVPNFVPLAADNGQFLTCKVTYGSGSASLVISEKRIHLNVSCE